MSDLTHFLEQLSTRINISDIIKGDVKLTRKNTNQYIGLCPFHKEKSGSFNVTDGKNLYHCFGCGASGNMFGYLEKKRGLTFIEALHYLADQVGMKVPERDTYTKTPEQKKAADRSYEILENTCIWMQENLQKSIGENARLYLEKRNISLAMQKQFRIGYVPEGYHNLIDLFKSKYTIEELLKVGLVSQGDGHKKPIDRFRGRLMFPIFDRQNKVIAFGGRALGDVSPKYINSSDTPTFSKSHILYGHNFASKELSNEFGFIVVEGYLDVISLHQHGFKTAVAPLGTALTDFHCKLLWRHRVPPLLCFDGDAAGYKAAVRSAKKSLIYASPDHRLNFVFLPKDEDPDSLVQKDRQHFSEMLTKFKPLSDVIWNSLIEDIPIKTPEDQAALRKEVSLLVSQIQNEDTKLSYKEYFQNKLFTYFRSLGQVSFKKNNYKKHDSDSKMMPLMVKKNKDDVFQKILLATLVYHPHLINQVTDEMLHINFNDELSDLSDWLLGYEGDKTKYALLDAAYHEGLKKRILMVISDDVLQKAPFLKQKDAENVLLGWKEVYNQLEYLLKLDEEVRQAGQLLKNDMTEQNWTRIKELQTIKLRSRENNE
ncbi:MAG: DNA primase [Alphaproteobacteria bacterium CG_4_10_14_0_8_um_filter_37_21]|nr:MAG: DNA primase [Alphaproteobacteria bacterium CG_4_10_14_0_8_um_filter_37_21]